MRQGPGTASAPAWVQQVCAPRAEPGPFWRAPLARPGLRRVGVILLALAALALPCAARQVALPGPFRATRAVFTEDATSGRARLGGWALRLFWDVRFAPSAAGHGLEPFALALGMASAAALVVSAVRRRPLRRAGVALVGVALVAVVAWQVRYGSGIVPWTSSALAAWATLPLVAITALVGRWTGVSVAALGLALGVVGVSAGRILYWGPLDDPWEIRVVALDVVYAVSLAGGGIGLAQRQRLGDCDLSGALSACPSPAEVALLPWAWWRLGEWAFERSLSWTRELHYGLGTYELQNALEGPVGRCATRGALAVAALLALAILLRARDRRDRGLAVAT